MDRPPPKATKTWPKFVANMITQYMFSIFKKHKLDKKLIEKIPPGDFITIIALHYAGTIDKKKLRLQLDQLVLHYCTENDDTDEDSVY